MNPSITSDAAREALKSALGMYGEVTLNLELWQDRKVTAREQVTRAQADLARAVQEEADAPAPSGPTLVASP